MFLRIRRKRNQQQLECVDVVRKVISIDSHRVGLVRPCLTQSVFYSGINTLHAKFRRASSLDLASRMSGWSQARDVGKAI